VLLCLKEMGVGNVRFHVTIPEDDPMWAVICGKMKAKGLTESIINHGRTPQKDLAEMYRRCTLCFLPTLLEVFSVSTLEAMFFDLKIVATDFPFNREVLDDAALYYEPMNAQQAATQLKRLMEDENLKKELSERMKRQLAQYSDYDQHFNDIVDFVVQVGQKRIKETV